MVVVVVVVVDEIACTVVAGVSDSVVVVGVVGCELAFVVKLLPVSLLLLLLLLLFWFEVNVVIVVWRLD